MSVKEINVQTGETKERSYTQKELDDINAAIAENLPAQQLRDALDAKKNTDIVALGTRAEMQTRISDMKTGNAAANSIPDMRTQIAFLIEEVERLDEIVYSNEKGTID